VCMQRRKFRHCRQWLPTRTLCHLNLKPTLSGAVTIGSRSFPRETWIQNFTDCQCSPRTKSFSAPSDLTAFATWADICGGTEGTARTCRHGSQTRRSRTASCGGASHAPQLPSCHIVLQLTRRTNPMPATPATPGSHRKACTQASEPKRACIESNDAYPPARPPDSQAAVVTPPTARSYGGHTTSAPAWTVAPSERAFSPPSLAPAARAARGRRYMRRYGGHTSDQPAWAIAVRARAHHIRAHARHIQSCTLDPPAWN
jgi:hypothetical protein